TALSWLAARLERLRQARQRMSFVYPVASSDGSVAWFVIHGARTLAVLPVPETPDDKRQTAQALRALFGERPVEAVREAHEHVDGRMLVMAWFRKYPQELERTLTPRRAMALCGEKSPRLNCP